MVPGRQGAQRRPKSRSEESPCRRRAEQTSSSRRGGTRADQAVELITGQPGISASDVAKTMKIKPNYLYRVLGDLEKEGRVKKDGRNSRRQIRLPRFRERRRPHGPASLFRALDQAELVDRVALLPELDDAGVDPLA